MEPAVGKAAAGARSGRDDRPLLTPSAVFTAFIYDVATDRVEWSGNVEALFGLSRDDPRLPSTQADLLSVVHPDDRDRVAADHAELNAKGGSFETEYRIVRPSDGSVRWIGTKGHASARPDGQPGRLIGIAQDVSVRVEHDERMVLLMREMAHRSKNLLSVVQAMARQTMRTATSIEAFDRAFSARLQALAASSDVLIAGNWRGAKIKALVHSQIEHLIDKAGQRIDAAGPDLWLEPATSQNLALAVHELSTNAVKYGALSTPGGLVSIVWRVEEGRTGDHLHFSWTESDGPPVAVPSRKGFGSFVLERLAWPSTDVRAAIEYKQDGVRWTLDAPLRSVVMSS